MVDVAKREVKRALANLEMFLKRIPEIRNLAIYRASGEDPHIVDALVNSDAFSRAGIEQQATEVALFSQELLGDVARATRTLLEEASAIQPRHKLLLLLGTGFPWVDEPRLEQWGHNPIREDLGAIWYLTGFATEGSENSRAELAYREARHRMRPEGGILAELASERRWDEAFARSADQLAELADAALREDAQGRTQDLDPDQLIE